MGSKRSQQGATLVDVIVVIAILLYLAYIIIPAGFSQSCGSKALRISCVSNLKQIGKGLEMYSAEYGCLPIQGPKSMLFDNGDGIIPDPNVFACPAVENPDPMGDYLRDVNWDGEAKANKVIVGDAPENHDYDAYIFLFNDGHVVIHPGTGNPPAVDLVKNIEGVADPDDGMYSGDGDSDPTLRTWLKIRD